MNLCFRFPLLACMLSLLVTAANGEEVTVDFTQETQYRVRFFADGMAREIPRQGLIQLKEGEKRHTIIAILPEAGRFEVVMQRAGKVKLEKVQTLPGPGGQGYRGQAEFVVQINRLSPEQAERQAEQSIRAELSAQFQQARQEREKKKADDIKAFLGQKRIPLGKNADVNGMYEKFRAAELGRDILRQKLKKFMEQHSQWFIKSDIEAVNSMPGPQAMQEYRDLLALDLGEQYLREMGLAFETNPRNFREVIRRHLYGIDAILSGSSDEKRDLGKRSLPQETREDLLSSIAIDASLRFYPAADEADPNSQWFLAQQVQCAIRGIKTVRIEGKLDPAQGDQSDWWVLTGVDRAKLDIDWPRTGLRYELFDEDSDAIKLRLVATSDQAVDYSIDFTSKAATRATRKVVIKETASRPNAKFPF